MTDDSQPEPRNDTPAPVPATPPRRLHELALSNVAAVAAGAGAVLVILRYWAVSHFDLTTASVLVRTTAPHELLFGWVLVSFPVLFLAAAAGFNAVASSERLPAHLRFRSEAACFLLIALSGLIVITPFHLAITLVLLVRVVTRSVVKRTSQTQLAWHAAATLFNPRLAAILGRVSLGIWLVKRRARRIRKRQAGTRVLVASLDSESEALLRRAKSIRRDSDKSYTEVDLLERRVATFNGRVQRLGRRLDRQTAMADKLEKAYQSLVERQTTARRASERMSLRILPSSLFGAAAAIYLLALTLLSAPTLPAETFTPVQGKSWSAHVLAEDDHKMLLMRVKDGKILRVEADDIAERSPCSLAGLPSQSPFLRLIVAEDSQPTYPQC